jgi:hypothetical protein
MAERTTNEAERERLFQLLGPETVGVLAEAVALARGTPVEPEELLVVAKWVRETWTAELLVEQVLAGELVVYLEDGRLTFRGRTSLQIVRP